MRYITWVKIESWHAVEGFVQGQPFSSLCGYHWTGFEVNLDTDDHLGIEKSCENCLRNLARSETLPPAILATDPIVEEEVTSEPLPITEPSSTNT